MLTLLAMLVLVPAARADVAGGPVVARDGDLTLRAKETGGDLCLTVGHSSGCERRPVSPYGPLVEAGRGYYAAGVVPAVATVELELRDGTRRSFPTVGAGGFRSRFVLVRRPGRVAMFRFHAADGRLIGAAEGDLENPPPALVLRSFRDGTTVKGRQVRELLPTPAEPDRMATRSCVDTGSEAVCVGLPSPTYTVAYEDRCARTPRRTIVGALPQEAVRVTLRLTDGTTAAAGALVLPDGNVFVLQTPRSMGVRRLKAFDGMGRTVLSRRVGFPPVTVCPRNYELGGSAELPVLAPDPASAVTLGDVAGERLVVADREGFLCLGIDRPRRMCLPPPVDSELIALVTGRATVGAAVAADVATVVLRRRGGGPRPTATFADARFPGIRFFHAPLPPGRGPVVAFPRGADGARLGVGVDFGARMLERRRLAGRRGRKLLLTRAEAAGETPRCVGSPGRLGADVSCADRSYAPPVLEVGCAPRRQGMIYALGRSFSVRLDDGRVLRPRRLRTAAGRVFVLFPPPRAGIASVGYEGRATRVDLPAAARQCGYSSDLIRD